MDRVLAGDLGLEQKIERIREIDEQDNEEGLEQVVRRASVQAARRAHDSRDAALQGGGGDAFSASRP